jgi:hypothetical protein
MPTIKVSITKAQPGEMSELMTELATAKEELVRTEGRESSRYRAIDAALKLRNIIGLRAAAAVYRVWRSERGH